MSWVVFKSKILQIILSGNMQKRTPSSTLHLPPWLPLPWLALLTQGGVVMVHGTGVKSDEWSSHCGSFACGKCTKISTNQFHEWMNQNLHNFMFEDHYWKHWKSHSGRMTIDNDTPAWCVSNDLVWKLETKLWWPRWSRKWVSLYIYLGSREESVTVRRWLVTVSELLLAGGQPG